ncbi:N-acetyltransferase eso1 [Sparassis crispa]|uniref:DNA polymerase eta n=1 Tax=Sparassis crispa TaxID=139825 RepID=A0A401H273_9APHY|nr:N-acetyltransferase eso1 [Sparassis crispa]GBE88531.1 N-acetyltransferase eso1 [Sparassis crispa]
MTSGIPSKPTSSSAKPASSIWKGKAKATEADYDDLTPVITYRHLYSQNLGVKDPLRVVALCDSDAFYAACEQVRLGIDPLKPLVVQQWDSLIAVNYPARKFGITRMAKVRDARRMCPDLVVVHVATYKEGEKEPGYWENPDTRTHKVSLDHYRRESMKIIQMFKDGLPAGEIEKASIDEAFIDFTRPVREEILKRYPYLAQVPPDAPHGADSALPPPPPILWDNLGTVIPITPPPPESSIDGANVTPEVSRPALEEEHESVQDDDGSTTWHDVALSIAAEYMEKIRDDIRTKLGYTTSAGIARNKFLAKLTASYKKPNSQSLLRNAAIPNYLRPLPFQKIRFLGGKLGKALAEQYDVSTVGDLLTISLEEMQRKFGENSIWVYEILRGIDRSEVKEKSVVNKSMLASKNLPQPITQTSQGHHWIRVLAAELALRLNEARESNSALWPKSIVLHVRQGYDTFRSKQTVFPFSRNVTVDLIASAGDKLWKELVGTEDTRATPMKITNVQLSFAGIESMEVGQRGIEVFLKTRSPSDEQTPQQRKNDDSPKRKRDPQDDAPAPPPPQSPTREDAASFVCDQCKKLIALPDALASGGIDGEIRAEALARLRVEHDDFHLAHELAKQSSGGGYSSLRPTSRQERNRGSGTNGDKEKKPGGIATFFKKR